jgi:predicted DNA-binding WGR domain protein
MLIVLHKHVPERNLHRFYALEVVPNLFGAWSLIRSWGRIGTPGQQRIDWHDTRDAAEQACDRLSQAKQRRGYCVHEDPARAAAPGGACASRRLSL